MRSKILNNLYRKVNNWFFPGMTLIILLLFCWHGLIKFSIWRGLVNYEKNNYDSAIIHLERATAIYPKSIGRFHLILSEMYFVLNDFDKSFIHAEKAKKINPEYDYPEKILYEIEKKLHKNN